MPSDLQPVDRPEDASLRRGQYKAVGSPPVKTHRPGSRKARECALRVFRREGRDQKQEKSQCM